MKRPAGKKRFNGPNFAENLTKRHFHSSNRVKLERRGYTKNIGANFIKLLTSKFTHSFCILLVEFF